jgi:hypothetical protein
VLVDRGHVVHVFTMRQPGSTTVDTGEECRHPNMHLYFISPNSGGGFDHSHAWERFFTVNTSYI